MENTDKLKEIGMLILIPHKPIKATKLKPMLMEIANSRPDVSFISKQGHEFLDDDKAVDKETADKFGKEVANHISYFLRHRKEMVINFN